MINNSIKKYEKYLIIAAAMAIALLMTNCGECNLISSNYPCRTVRVQLTQFNPVLVYQDDSTVIKSDGYSLATFLFPNGTGDGIREDDARFGSNDLLNQFIVIEEKSFINFSDGKTYKAQLVAHFPPNAMSANDLILVIAPSDTNMPAFIRLYGDVAQFPDKLDSSGNNYFCEKYLAAYREKDNDYAYIRQKASRFGEGLVNSKPATFSIDNIRVLDSFGKDVTGAPEINIPPATVSDLLSSSKAVSIDIQVGRGDVYYYKARSGKEFAVHIIDYRASVFGPVRRTITFEFNELNPVRKKGCQ